MMGRRGRSRRLGLAIGRDRVVAVLDPAGEASTREFRLRLDAREEDPAPALRSALEEVAEWIAFGDAGRPANAPDLRGMRVDVALLPPLADTRVVELPPLRPEEAGAILRRTVSRHFVGRREDAVAGAATSSARHEGGPAPALAAVADRAIAEAVHQAVAAMGWTLGRIVPAQGAWVAAAGSLERAEPHDEIPGHGRRVALVAALLEGTVHLLRIEADRVVQLRRRPWPAGADLGEALERADGARGMVEGARASAEGHPLAGDGRDRVEGGRAPAARGRALVLSDHPDAFPVLVNALREAGWDSVEGFGIALAGSGGAAAHHPAPAAARHAGSAEPELVPRGLVQERRSARKRTILLQAAGAAALLVLAAAAHLWGTARALPAIQEERAQLAQAVAPALAARDSLDRMRDRLAELEGLARGDGRWALALVEISMLLPDDTHLLSLRAAGDTVVLEAAGGRAGDALAALRDASALEDLRLEGAIQRDLVAGTTSRERFTLSAILGDGKAHHADPEGASW